MAVTAFKATGYGNLSTARNVFGLAFSTALSSLCTYKCFENDQAFPTIDTVETVANIVLHGTAGHTESMVCLVDTTNAAPSSDWKPASATGGSANPNRMEGAVSYVTQAGAIRGAGERITYNMVVEVPHDALTTDPMGFDLKVTYSYTGAAPSLTWSINTGTEGTPSWQTITPKIDVNPGYGILHCRAGSGPVGHSGDGKYYANIPETLTELTAQAWADKATTPTEDT
jgi:hypothetical protein